MDTLVTTSVIISIFFAIVFIVMAYNIGKIRGNLREITYHLTDQKYSVHLREIISHLTDQKYIVYLTNTDEWFEYTWEMIGVDGSYIKDLSFVNAFEVRKKLKKRFDVPDSYTILKRFDDIEQAKEYYKSLLKKPKQ